MLIRGYWSPAVLNGVGVGSSSGVGLVRFRSERLPKNSTSSSNTPDATSDATPDATPDATSDAAPDATPDATPDAAPDAIGAAGGRASALEAGGSGDLPI